MTEINKYHQELLEKFDGTTAKYIADRLPRHGYKTYDHRLESDISLIVLHTTDWEVTPFRLAEYDIGPNHISGSGCPGITYHELVTESTAYQTLDYTDIAWHVGNYNDRAVGVAMVYRCTNPNGKDTIPPVDNLVKLTQSRLAHLCLRFGLPPSAIVGHRELKGTGWFFHKGSKKLRKTCPGLRVNMDLIRKNVGVFLQIFLVTKTLYGGKIDGVWGPLSQSAYERYLRAR